MSTLRIIIINLCLIFSAAANAQNADKGIFVDPATIDFNLLNGQSSTAVVRIINRMDVKKQFKVYLNDWERDTLGKHRYIEPNTISNSCSRWVTFDKSFLELEPGEAAEITVKLQVPDSIDAVKRMLWSMLFIETIEEKKAPTKIDGVMTSIHASFRVGVHIYQTPPTQNVKEMQMLSFSPRENSMDSVYRVACKNIGQTQLHCKSYVELVHTTTGKKTRLDPIEFPMFPDQLRYIDFVLPATLEKGKYTITAAVDAGEELPLEVAEKVIDIN